MIKKASKLIAIFILLVTVLTAFSSCTLRKLNAEFFHQGEIPEENYLINFYGLNQFWTFETEYDPIIDAYRAHFYSGTYKIYKDPNNPESLLIKFNCRNSQSAVYSYEEIRHDDGSMTITIDGVEFKSTEDHPSGYAFKKFLRNMGWIE